MSEIFESDDVFVGQVSLVTSIAEDGTRVDFRFPNGRAGFMTRDEPFELQVGAIILIEGNQYRLGDISMWPEPPRIGVVRHVLDQGLLVEEGYAFHLVPNRDPGSVAVGQTVVYGDVGIREKLADTPIQPRGIGASDVEPDKYLWKSGEQKLSFHDFGGYPDVVARARELIETPLNRAEELKSIGARPIKGVLFTGSPGTGKTHLARIIADQSDAAFYSISGPEIVSKWMGDSEGNLRMLFEDAERKERAVVFFDEIDSLAEKRSEESHESSKRVVAQLLTLMDGFETRSSNIVVIAATNRPDDIDPALRRPGRFDWEIDFPMPSFADRLAILEVSMRQITVSDPDGMPLKDIATRTEGWSAARLTSLWTESALLAAGDGRGSLYVEDLIGAFERLSSRQNVLKGGE